MEGPILNELLKRLRGTLVLEFGCKNIIPDYYRYFIPRYPPIDRLHNEVLSYTTDKTKET